MAADGPCPTVWADNEGVPPPAEVGDGAHPPDAQPLRRARHHHHRRQQLLHRGTLTPLPAHSTTSNFLSNIASSSAFSWAMILPL